MPAMPAAAASPADRPWRRSDPRVVSRPADSAGRRQHLLAPQQHQLHADGRAERAAAHASFPNLVVDNFYRKTKNSIESGKTEAPYGYVIPVQRDMTRVAELVNILRVQRIEIGLASAEIKVSDGTFPAGSYVIKRDQPYGRLAKNLLERQSFPDPNLRTYDDSGWTMGLAMLTDVKEIKDKAILDVKTTTVKEAVVKGRIAGSGTAGLAVAHFGSNNMIALRYALRNVPMKIVEKSFTADGVEFPAGSFVIAAPADLAAARAVD